MNGVEQHEGHDFEVNQDRIRFLTPLQEFRPVVALGNLRGAIGGALGKVTADI